MRNLQALDLPLTPFLLRLLNSYSLQCVFHLLLHYLCILVFVLPHLPYLFRLHLFLVLLLFLILSYFLADYLVMCLIYLPILLLLFYVAHLVLQIHIVCLLWLFHLLQVNSSMLQILGLEIHLLLCHLFFFRIVFTGP